MISYEIEQKYRLKNLSAMRRRLRAFGARKLSGGTEYNALFDREGMLRFRKQVLRLREFSGKGRLTLKGPRMKRKHYSRRMEIETAVDFGKMEQILKMTGFRKTVSYRKYREEYLLSSCTITLDRVPRFGRFLEIEGAPEKIRKVAARLGLGDRDKEPRSYLEMIFGKRKFEG
ncbi:MAG TPA: class IV adenylate cyclase [Candidatus Omnitrophota bacterium]|nr:class IV adenylate cyclase [Candidatus Omnitrophota bacterium]